MRKAISLLLFVSLLCFSLSACSKEKEYPLVLDAEGTLRFYDSLLNERG